MKILTMVEVAIPEAASRFYATRDPLFWEAYAAEYVAGLLREDSPKGYDNNIAFNSEVYDRKFAVPDIDGPLTYRDPDWWRKREVIKKQKKTVKRKTAKRLKSKRK